MKILNKDKLTNKPYTVFVTSYCGLGYFLQWEHLIDTENIQLILIDSGNQPEVNTITKYPILQTSVNVGCAGSWNTAAYFGFIFLGLDKIIIGQDDALFNADMVQHVWNESNDDVFAGAYDTGFTFSLFGLTRNLWDTVGVFDENFVYVTYEDNDYIHRLRLLGKEVKCLNYPRSLNSNIASSKISKDTVSKNRLYMEQKWGHFEGVYTHPFDNPELKISDCIVHPHLIEVFGQVDNFPSIIEFDNMVKEHATP